MPASDEALRPPAAAASTGGAVADPHACLDGDYVGAVNLRPVAGGPLLRPGRLYRSGGTHLIDAEGLARLGTSLGIRTVVDLRTLDEVEKVGVSPFEDHGIVRHHAPMEDPLDRQPGARLARLAQFRAGKFDWSEVYVRVAESSGPSVRRAFELIAAEAELPLVVHCAAGRDRTGITVALVLGAIGVDRDTIADDYHRSGVHLTAQTDRFFPTTDRPGSLTREEAMRILATDRADLLRFLAALDAAYGSPAAYLASIGVGDALLASLRSRLLDGTHA